MKLRRYERPNIKVGQRFSRWTIIGFDVERSNQTGRGFYFVECICQHKTKVSRPITVLINGQSPGCRRCKKGLTREKPGMIGKVFHDWTVIAFNNDFSEKVKYECYDVKCICGQRRTIRGWELRSGKSKCCGHNRSEIALNKYSGNKGAATITWKLNEEQKKLVEEYSWIPKNICKATDDEELSLAHFALCDAAYHYKQDGGQSFKTFAYVRIRSRISSHLLRDYNPINISEQKLGIFRQLNKIRNLFHLKTGQVLKDEDLAIILDIPIYEITELKAYQSELISIDIPIGEAEEGKDKTLGDTIADKKSRSPLENCIALEEMPSLMAVQHHEEVLREIDALKNQIAIAESAGC